MGRCARGKVRGRARRVTRTDDLHIRRIRPLISPAVLAEELAADENALALVETSRRQVEAILDGRDTRQLVIVGPCSIHDTGAALEYAGKLFEKTRGLEERLLIVMRVYFEKPRTVVGWKGLINDPDLDGSYRINKGLRLARKLLIDVTEIGLPSATEFLDTTFGQYYADLVSWGAIGARTVESQVHRELASGLSMPVGMKNRTDGDIKVAVDAIRAAAHRHLFPSITKEGAPAIFETGGNDYAHLILRGGDRTGPNFDAASVARACEVLRQDGVAERLVIDCSHANSAKDPARQVDVVASVAAQIRDAGGVSPIKGVMLESHLKSGRQDYVRGQAIYGMSITDGCLSLDETLPLLETLFEAGSMEKA
ncbi:MAG: 3-deoxy-7-phosphoheptulonate synthase [Pseudomonadales bacterium]|nr:3-deoxy-7-phosphoheptulonate synthase [Pseudomonadales bacterium]